MDEILAKSNPQVTLKQHIKDGISVWHYIRKCFPLAPSCAGKKNFWRLLWLSIVLHDLGKAHSEFQKVLHNLPNNWYSQRHELFSLPFVKQLKIPDDEKLLVLRVIAAHHKNYSWLSNFIENNYELDPEEFEREFVKVDVRGVINLTNSFEEGLITDEVIPESPLPIIADYQCEAKEVIMGRREEISDYFSLLLLMGAFHHCDHLASAFVIEFDYLQDNNFIFLDKMKADLQEVGNDLYYHQNAASQLSGHVILTAPTGSGKTETSMLWLRNQLQQTGQGRVFYVLPFTASINAMYERLSSNNDGLGEDIVGMIHGKLDAYLYESFFEERGSLHQLKSQIKDLKQAFKNLQTPLKVLTPFQLLKNLFGLKGFEKGVFEWAGGHFIFDEIHAYDPEVTAQIIVLLEYLNERLQAKIFVMTATLPTFLKKRIGKAIGSFEEIKAKPELYDAFKRHRLKLENGLLAEKLGLIKKDLKIGKNVLVVCNTVEQSRKVFNEFHNDYGALLIHGRFTAKDRTQIERQLQNKPPQLLVGTQAIEVSLDIDYDVIYTEPAPLDALIQRFGRVNRKCAKQPCPCIVFQERNEKDEYIYNQVSIHNTLEVLKEIEGKNEGIIQEIELQQYIDQVYPGYDEKSQEKFDKIYNLLIQTVNKLTPFEPSQENEEDYYKQFDGVKVLPAYYEKEFRKHLDEFDFVGAEQLKVSIRKNWFAGLINSPGLERQSHILFPFDGENSKSIEFKYFKINKKYRPQTGLELETDEDDRIVVDSSDNIIG